MIVAIAGGVLAFWLFVIWRVKVERGDVGVSEWKRFEIRLRVAVEGATRVGADFGRALVALAPAVNRVTVAMRELVAAVERTSRAEWDSSVSPTSGETKTGPNQ